MHTNNLTNEVGVSVLLNVWAGDDEQALDWSMSSIFAQTLTPRQLVVVIDGAISAELQRTIDSKLALANCPYVVEHLSKNSGLAIARNIGISHCRTDLIALHDADDIMHPERLQVQTALFMSLKPAVLGTTAYEFDVSSRMIVGQRRTAVERPLRMSDVWLTNPIHHSSVLMSKGDVTAVGLYHECPGAEDLNLWRRLIRDGAVVTNTRHVLQALGTNSLLLKRRRISAALLHGEVRLAIDQLRSAKLSEAITAPASFLTRCTYRTLPLPLMTLFQRQYLRTSKVRHELTLESYLREPAPVAELR